jgi:chromosomal replication initiation ATPase DnaA
MNAARTNMGQAQEIIRVAEKQIEKQTGYYVTLMLAPSNNARKYPEQMMRIIADALDTNLYYYQTKGRKREIVELRFVAALLLRNYYPTITLKQIAMLFGGQDHTSVINAIKKGRGLLHVKDELFSYKYDLATQAVDNWLKES